MANIIIIINDSIYPAVSKASRTGNKISCQPNDCPNRWVFKRRLKTANDGAGYCYYYVYYKVELRYEVLKVVEV